MRRNCGARPADKLSARQRARDRIILELDHPKSRIESAEVQLIIYQPINAAPAAFIDFWAARYAGYDDTFYMANVGQELTEARILDWFTWKNGTTLSDRSEEHTSELQSLR